MVGRGGRYGTMRVIGMAFLCVRQCAPLRHCWPPASPPSRALPPLRVLPWGLVSLYCCSLFFVFGRPLGHALHCSRAPCVCPMFFSVLPLSCRPVPPHSPVFPPIHRLSADPACIVRPPALPLLRCHSCVPPACSTPAPLCCPYPFPCWLTHPSVIPTVPVSHLIRDAMVPSVGRGGFLLTGLWPCPRTGMTLAVGIRRPQCSLLCPPQ